MTQQGDPVQSRKGRERNDSPYIEERTRSSNKNARRGVDLQRQDQERRGTWTKKSVSLEVLLCLVEKQRSAFDQVSEFDRGRIVAYRDCGLSIRESGSRVGRNQKTVMRICDRWMQEGTTHRRGRSYPPQCTTSREDSTTDVSATNGAIKEERGRQNGMKLFLLTSLQQHDGRIRVWRHRGERMLNSCVMHRHTGPAPGIIVWGVIGYHSCTPLVRIAGTLNSQCYISEVLEPVVLPYLQGLATAIISTG
ncbi:transposable element Tcb1 transposase [Trichonephila clavipes]|uniref:Transposable element Tcb1 transposase n=1 Tax=Trichonephila clavipes TaxID=2585209 RepID=A0A8X6SS28_TRICX|nr:transposable element Tcb1 transposase [Trichonephila clavipes]